MAPNYLERRYDINNVQFKLDYQGLKFENWWWQQNNAGLGADGAQTIDHTGYQNGNVYRGVLSYQSNDHQNFSYHLSGYYQRMNLTTLIAVFPAGAILPIGENGNINFANTINLVTFKEGFLGKPSVHNQDGNLNATLNYQGFKDHNIRLNMGFSKHLARVKESKNFGPGIFRCHSNHRSRSINRSNQYPIRLFANHAQNHRLCITARSMEFQPRHQFGQRLTLRSLL